MGSGAAGYRRGWRLALLCAAMALLVGCQAGPGPASSPLPSGASTSGVPTSGPGASGDPAPVPTGLFAASLEDVPFRITLPVSWRLGTAAEVATFWEWLGIVTPELRAGLESQAAFKAAGVFIAYDGTENDPRNPSLHCSAIAMSPMPVTEALDKGEHDNVQALENAPGVVDGPTADRVNLPAGEAVRILWRERGMGLDVSSAGYLLVVGPHLVTCVFRARTDEVESRRATWDAVLQSIAPGSSWTVTATIPVGIKPFEITAGGGFIWVANAFSSEISRIDPATNQLWTFPVDSRPDEDSAIWDIEFDTDLDLLWVTVMVFDERGDPVRGELMAADLAFESAESVPVGRGPMGIGVAFGSAWVANQADGTVSRIDQVTFDATTIVVESAPFAVVASDEAIWVGHEGGTLTRIDPTTNELTPFEVGANLRALAVGERGIWAAADDALYLVDPASGKVLATVDVPAAVGLAATGGTIWAAESMGIFVHEIDEASATIVDSVQLDTNSWGLVELDGSLWVVQPAAAERKWADEAPGTVTRLDRRVP